MDHTLGAMSKDQNASIANSTNRKEFAIREFDWFVVETKVRKLIQDLLQPSVKKFSEDRKIVDQLQDSLRTTQSRIEDLQSIVIRQSGKRLPVFEEIDQKLHRMDVKCDSNAQHIKQRLSKLKSRVSQLERGATETNAQFEKVFQLKTEFRNDQEALQQNFLKFQENLEQRLHKWSSEILQSSEKALQQTQQFDQNLKDIRQVLHEQQKKVEFQGSELSSLHSLTVSNSSEIQRLETQRIVLNEALANQDSRCEQLRSQLCQCENNLQQIFTVENFIEKYQIVYTHAHLSEVLQKVLGLKKCKRLLEYDQKFFEQVNAAILKDSGRGNLDLKIREGRKLIEQVLARNRKMIKEIRRQELLARRARNENEDDLAELEAELGGGGVKDLPPFLKNNNGDKGLAESGDFLRRIARQNTLKTEVSPATQERSQSTQAQQVEQQATAIKIQDDRQRSEQRASSSVNVTNNAISVDKNSSLINSSAQNPGFSAHELQTLVKTETQLECAHLKNMFDARVNEVARGVTENEELIHRAVSQLEQQLDLILKKQNGRGSDEQLMYREFEKKVLQIYSELEKIVATFNKLSETVHKVLHFSTINNHLAIQDEIDKQSIALYGIRENFHDMGTQNHWHANHQSFGTKTLSKLQKTHTDSQPIEKDQSQHTISQKGLDSTIENVLAKPVLQMDKNCLSCKGGSAVTHQAFKMACLAYQPTSILVDGKLYRRDELLELATKVLQAARNDYGMRTAQQSNSLAVDEQAQPPPPQEDIFTFNNNNNNSNNNISLLTFEEQSQGLNSTSRGFQPYSVKYPSSATPQQQLQQFRPLHALQHLQATQNSAQSKTADTTPKRHRQQTPVAAEGKSYTPLVADNKGRTLPILDTANKAHTPLSKQKRALLGHHKNASFTVANRAGDNVFHYQNSGEV